MHNIASHRPRRIAKHTVYAVSGLALTLCMPVSAAPKVVASLMPIQSLIAGVMGDAGTPAVIIQGYGSPHVYSLRPSEAATLSHADIVFWIGRSMETFLQKPLSTLARKAQVVALLDTEGLILLPNREAGVWEVDYHGEQGGAVGSHAHARTDPHIWLAPVNAKLLVDEIAKQLGKVDAANATTYRRNALEVSRRIDALERDLRSQLQPVQAIPYAVFHDSFQYFEHHFGLHAVGSLTLSPDRMAGARRLRELRETIKERGARCVFSEPQFKSALIKTVIEGTNARRGVLDPLGAGLRPGPGAYFEMMRANAAAIVDCLS